MLARKLKRMIDTDDAEETEENDSRYEGAQEILKFTETIHLSLPAPAWSHNPVTPRPRLEPRPCHSPPPLGATNRPHDSAKARNTDLNPSFGSTRLPP